MPLTEHETNVRTALNRLLLEHGIRPWGVNQYKVLHRLSRDGCNRARSLLAQMAHANRERSQVGAPVIQSVRCSRRRLPKKLRTRDGKPMP